MGSRATYAIKDNGVIELRYAQHGGQRIPLEMFWGPVSAGAVIRTLERREDWVDDIFAEGGVALDKDKRAVTLFGGRDLLDGIEKPFEELMSAVWARHGWTVQWATGILQVAAAVDVDPKTIEAPGPTPVAIARLGERFLTESMYQGLVSVREGNRWRDYVSDHPMERLLVHGPSILDSLPRLPGLAACRAEHARRGLRDYEKQRGTLGDHLGINVVVAPEEKELVCHSDLGMENERDERFVRAAWPGWKVVWRQGTLGDHMAATGRHVEDEHVPIGCWEGAREVNAAPTEEEATARLRSIITSFLAQDPAPRDPFRLLVADQLEARRLAKLPAWKRDVRRFLRPRHRPGPPIDGFFDEVPMPGLGGLDVGEIFEEANRLRLSTPPPCR